MNPYALLIGATSVSMFALHGLAFLTMKVDGDVEQRVRRLLPKVMAVFLVLTTLSVAATALYQDQISERFESDIWALFFPGAALAAFLLSARLLLTGRDFWGFVASAATIGLLLFSGAVGLYPNLLISDVDARYNLTVDNAASASNTLTVMLVFAVIGIPLILLYTSGVYYFFRGKTVVGSDGY
jgi:cytochrome d ubiquinol oxidase subunit II